jgi:hypothetical protein
MGRHSRRNNRAEETVDPVVRALKFVAQNSDFDRAWRPADDYGCIIDQVFDVPRGMKDELTAVHINSHLSNDPCYSPFVDFDKAGSNATGIFRKEYQYKTPDGKNCKSKYLYLCSENELPVKPEGKWYCDIKALHAGWDKGPRGMGENENYKKIRIDLLILLRELRKKQERPKKKAMDKRERDKEPTDEPSAKKSRAMSEKEESSRIAHLLRQVLDSSWNDDAKEAVSQGDVRSLLRLAFRINQHLDSLTKDDAKEAASRSDTHSLLQFLALETNRQHEEIKELDEDEDEDYTPEFEMEDDDEIEDELEYDPETYDETGHYGTRVLFLGNKEFDVPKSHEFISCSRRSRLEKDQRLATMLKAKVRLTISRNGETRRPKQYRSS